MHNALRTMNNAVDSHPLGQTAEADGCRDGWLAGALPRRHRPPRQHVCGGGWYGAHRAQQVGVQVGPLCQYAREAPGANDLYDRATSVTFQTVPHSLGDCRHTVRVCWPESARGTDSHAPSLLSLHATMCLQAHLQSCEAPHDQDLCATNVILWTHARAPTCMSPLTALNTGFSGKDVELEPRMPLRVNTVATVLQGCVHRYA